MTESIGHRHIQLTELPNLEEVKHASKETSVEKILAKAIALQLKTLNADITRFAFDRLLMLIDDQLDGMIGHLHRISNIQRRESIAEGDIQLFLQGFNISPTDLYIQDQFSNYISSNFKEEYELLHSLKESYIETEYDEGEQIEDVLTTLVPPTNSLKNSLPRWFPALPPDHTYKFTPQFNHPITDEVSIRKKVVEEGKKSELALLHLLHGREGSTNKKSIPDFDNIVAAEETIAIYGFSKQKRKKNFNSSGSMELISKLPQNNFDVEEYARNRVELSRRKVQEYEEKTLQLENDPFLKASKLILSSTGDRISKRQVNKEIKTMLKRSFYSMIKSIPDLHLQKKQAKEQANIEREKRLEEMRIMQEQREKEKNEKVRNGEINLLDLDHQDDIFGSLDSSDDELQPQTEIKLKMETQNHDQSEPLENNALSSTLKSADSADQNVNSDANQKQVEEGNSLQDGNQINQESATNFTDLNSTASAKQSTQEINDSKPESKSKTTQSEGKNPSSEEDDDSGFLFNDVTETNNSTIDTIDI